MIYTNQEIEEARNSKGKDRRVYKSRRINNFRELVSYSVEHYADILHTNIKINHLIKR